MDFDGLKATGIGASLTWIVGDEVSTSGSSSSIEIIFFRSVCADRASIDDSATIGNLMFVDEKDGVGAFDIARRKPLS